MRDRWPCYLMYLMPDVSGRLRRGERPYDLSICRATARADQIALSALTLTVGRWTNNVTAGCTL